VLNKVIDTIKYQLFSKKITFFRWQLNIYSSLLIVLGFGICIFLGATGIMNIKATAQSTYNVDTNTDFNLGTYTQTTVSGSGSGAVVQLANRSWIDSAWLYRKKIVFNNSSQSENLINFPALVKLTSANFDFNKAQASGQDIRFSDSDGSI